jgi:hypothetical protein
MFLSLQIHQHKNITVKITQLHVMQILNESDLANISNYKRKKRNSTETGISLGFIFCAWITLTAQQVHKNKTV